MQLSRTIISFGLLAATLPTAFSLGCYSKGPTFEDVFANTSIKSGSLADAIADFAEGAWPGGEQRGFCYQANGFYPATLHVDVVIKNNSWFWQNLNRYAALGAAMIEITACDHGSEQNHGNFWYRIDPNDGTC